MGYWRMHDVFVIPFNFKITGKNDDHQEWELDSSDFDNSNDNDVIKINGIVLISCELVLNLYFDFRSEVKIFLVSQAVVLGAKKNL